MRWIPGGEEIIEHSYYNYYYYYTTKMTSIFNDWKMYPVEVCILCIKVTWPWNDRSLRKGFRNHKIIISRSIYPSYNHLWTCGLFHLWVPIYTKENKNKIAIILTSLKIDLQKWLLIVHKWHSNGSTDILEDVSKNEN